MTALIDIVKFLASSLNRGGANSIVAVGCAVWLTVWVGMRIRDLELRWIELEKKHQFSWTVQMMSEYNRTLRTTNEIPVWDIYWDMKEKYK